MRNTPAFRTGSVKRYAEEVFMDTLRELENSINGSLENMRHQLEWDEMQAAEMDEAGRIDEMEAWMSSQESSMW